MRGIACQVLIVVGAGVFAAGCGSVTAKADAGNGGGDDAEVTPDAAPGCTPDSLSCGDDDALYRCEADGAALTKVQDCQYGCSVDHCKDCAANTTFCNNDDLVMCSADGEIVNPMTCSHGCQMDRCNTCDPGVAYCNSTNTTAITCGADGTPASMMDCGSAGCTGGVCNACQPNTTSCNGDTLVVCNANGGVQSTTPCALGCGDSPTSHCKVLEPSYGVGVPSGNLPNLAVDQNATLDIGNCGATPPTATLTIGTTETTLTGTQVSQVTQLGNAAICVVRFGTITIDASTTLTVVNGAGHSLSLQAVGDIDISGLITFVNSATGPSPGKSVQSVGTNANNKTMAPGPGGGGAAFAGGTGGMCVSCNSSNVPGGMGGPAVTTTVARLNGGSSGGNVTGGILTTYGFGGHGGGGLQLVSLSRVTIAATGGVALNGEGGYGLSDNKFTMTAANLPAGGGGSGGTLVVEAPSVTLSSGALAVANGGGGAGGCTAFSGVIGKFNHVNGQPGQLSNVRSSGGDCANTTAGDGGYEATGAASPPANGANSDSGAANQAGGGGGGSPGFVILRGKADTSVMVNSGALVSPTPSIGAVTAN
jgi:hypothetical protein